MIMRYEKFIIEQYKGIYKPLEINITKSDSPPIIPIIGTNESGKSSILYACLAFDHRNDKYDSTIGHLKDCQTNLYIPEKAWTPTITVHLECSSTFIDIFNKEHVPTLTKKISVANRKKRDDIISFCNDLKNNALVVTRNLLNMNDNTKGYSINQLKSVKSIECDFFNFFIDNIPPIIYFDDFRDSIPNIIYFNPEKQFTIPSDAEDEVSKELNVEGYLNRAWYSLLNTLFINTLKDASDIKELKEIEEIDENRRNSLLNRMTNTLNLELQKFWDTIKLDEKLNSITIEIKYNNYTKLGGGLNLKIIDDGNYFNLEHRSKGFKWFFNFIMKVKYYPSKTTNTNTNISTHVFFLLDEPGSYLHPEAQRKLCEHLSTILNDVQNGSILYTTHSLYLLNPQYISINNIHIASNNISEGKHNISLSSYKQVKQNIKNNKNIWQPIMDAIKINNHIQIDANQDKVILVEGITDFYALKLFWDIYEKLENIRLLPCEGAGGIGTNIAYMLAWNIPFAILLDNDKAGKNAIKSITKFYTTSMEERIITYPHGELEKEIVDSEIRIMKEIFDIPQMDNIKKHWISMYFSNKKSNIDIQTKLPKTVENFNNIFHEVSKKFND